MTPGGESVKWAYEAGFADGRAALLQEQADAARAAIEKQQAIADRFLHSILGVAEEEDKLNAL